MNLSSIFGIQHFQATTWPELLQAAATPEEILGLVRDFLATWTPEEFKALPPECRPLSRFAEPAQVVLFAFALAQARCLGTERTPELIRMDSFFAEAAKCIAMAMGRPAPIPIANA
jgi:hypothetical protein